MGRHAHRTSRITSHSERVLPLEQEVFICLKIVENKNRIKEAQHTPSTRADSEDNQGKRERL